MSQYSMVPSSLREILNLDKAEAVFQRLLEAVGAHSSELAAVKRDVSSKAGSAEVCSMCQHLEDRIKALERRVSNTEAAVTIPPGGRPINSGSGDDADIGPGVEGSAMGNHALGVTVGEAVRANDQALQVVIKQLAKKSDREELVAKPKVHRLLMPDPAEHQWKGEFIKIDPEDPLRSLAHKGDRYQLTYSTGPGGSDELESYIRDRERSIRQWGVGRDFADSLGRAQRGLAGQLGAVEGVLATKLNKSELDNMQAACAKVSTVSEFLDEVSTRVSNLEAGLDGEQRERRQEAEATKGVLDRVLRELVQKTNKRDSESLKEQVEDVRKAFVDETNAGRKQLRTLKQGADMMKRALDRLSESSGERLRDLEACLEGAATKAEVALKADARYTDAAISALQADCTLRARQGDFLTLETAVSSLAVEHAKTRRASDLAARFVDWFSSRGEAYEHNLGAVEKHIENLATRSVGALARPGGGGSRQGAVREPYGGSVRFTPP